MAVPRSGTFVWVTWLSRLMAGDVSCEWAPWFRSHYQNYTKAPSDFNLADWNIRHTRLLRELRIEKEETADRVMLEGQNQFYWERPSSGLVVSGKPDLIAISGNVAQICDTKTGQPRPSDAIQVRLYMYCIPQAIPTLATKTFVGQLVYEDHRVDIPAGAAGKDFEENLHYFLDILATSIENAPRKTPSAGECRFCDIGRAECSERIDAPVGAGDGEHEP